MGEGASVDHKHKQHFAVFLAFSQVYVADQALVLLFVINRNFVFFNKTPYDFEDLLEFFRLKSLVVISPSTLVPVRSRQ